MPELLPPTKRGLCEPRDEELWEQLVADVQGGNCALFVGSGPSVPTYGTWRDLVSAVAAAAALDCPTGLVPSQFPEFLEKCRLSMPDTQYQNILKSKLTPEGKDSYRPVHSAMLRANFRTYVTTNFDNMIENAGYHQDTPVSLEGVQRYPDELNPVLLGRRYVTHLHGQAYDHLNGECLLPHIVLTSRDFDSAYQSPDVPEVLRYLLRQYDVVFIGFSADDGVLRRVLDTHMRSYLENLTRSSSRRGAVRGRPRRFYVVRGVVLKNDPENRVTGTAHEDDTEARAEMETWFALPPHVVGEVVPVLYVVNQGDAVHTVLERLLDDLARRGRYTSPPPLRPLGRHLPYPVGVQM